MTFDDTDLTDPPPDPPRLSDRKTSREFYASRPSKSLWCVFAGCARRFRPCANYSDFLTHFNAKHGKGVKS